MSSLPPLTYTGLTQYYTNAARGRVAAIAPTRVSRAIGSIMGYGATDGLPTLRDRLSGNGLSSRLGARRGGLVQTSA